MLNEPGIDVSFHNQPRPVKILDQILTYLVLSTLGSTHMLMVLYSAVNA